MVFLKYGGIILVSATFLLLLVFYYKTGKLLKNFLINAFIGVVALAVITLTSSFTGVKIPINEWTFTGSAVLGLPAVCGFILLPIIFV